ncbi:MAG: hypothetical protein C0467_17135 [Planctomycetaceae bacterium]|nr:hypothetical protein [Planctomycetaceae bacterium]
MTRNRMIRPAFTLVEMMVAMALSLGIMLILTESFKMSLDFVRGAHSTGELISQLNGAGILLSRDLQTDHFLDAKSAKNGPKLSDQRLDQVPTAAAWSGLGPTGGFFKIVSTDPGTEALAPSDAQGFKINAPAVNHQLHFTSVLPSASNASSFTVNSGGTTYSSQAAEIAYFLVPMPGKTTSVQAGGQQLYNLIRRQRLVAYSSDEVTSLTPVVSDTEVISNAGANVNTMATVMNPANRMPLSQLSSPARFGEDIVVSNVLSFEVQADWTPGTITGSTTAPRAFATNTDAPYDFIQGGGTFDTGAATPPQFVQIKSLQILIRIYDPRTKQTRQNTWKFAM